MEPIKKGKGLTRCYRQIGEVEEERWEGYDSYDYALCFWNSSEIREKWSFNFSVCLRAELRTMGSRRVEKKSWKLKTDTRSNLFVHAKNHLLPLSYDKRNNSEIQYLTRGIREKTFKTKLSASRVKIESQIHVHNIHRVSHLSRFYVSALKELA